MLDASTQEALDTHDQRLAVGRLIRNEFHTSASPEAAIDQVTVVSHEAHRLEWVYETQVRWVGIRLLHTNRMQWLTELAGWEDTV